MECPYHAGSEAISSCIQCQKPICSLCSVETGQPVLCLECYRARVTEITNRFSGAPGTAKARGKASLAEGMAKTPPAPEEVPAEAKLDKKELKRLKKEEARRLKEERKRAKEEAKLLKKAGKEEATEAPPQVEEAGLFVEAPTPAESRVEPATEAIPLPRADIPGEERKPAAAAMEEMPLGFPAPSQGGVKLPRMEDKLEKKPPAPDELPLDLEPPEGFFE
ncbi:MAG: B-box zinc finger protein [Candidatus Geothermincolales bacterium]